VKRRKRERRKREREREGRIYRKGEERKKRQTERKKERNLTSLTSKYVKVHNNLLVNRKS
jgi:hypothetical protein